MNTVNPNAVSGKTDEEIRKENEEKYLNDIRPSWEQRWYDSIPPAERRQTFYYEGVLMGMRAIFDGLGFWKAWRLYRRLKNLTYYLNGADFIRVLPEEVKRVINGYYEYLDKAKELDENS